MSEQSKLSAPTRIKTTAPFVEATVEKGSNPPVVKHVESSDRKIEAEICSELTRYHTNLEYFEKNGGIQLVHDSEGAPAVFSLDTKNRLCLLRYISGTAEGWSSQILSPDGLKLTAFDVLEHNSRILIAAIAVEKISDKESFTLRYISLKLDKEEASEQAGEGKPRSYVNDWTTAKDNVDNPLHPLHLSSVMWQPPPEDPAQTSPNKYQIIVGTKASESFESSRKTGTFYVVQVGDSQPNPWGKLSFPSAASQLLQTVPMILNDGPDGKPETAMASVFQDFSESGSGRCAGHVYSPSGGLGRDFEVKAGVLNGVNSVFSHYNPWHTTDLFISGRNGIGICDAYDRYDTVTQRILEGISFKQVVCAESEDSLRPETHTKLAIYALSEENQLYYVDGERNYAVEKPNMSFSYSGLPIRSNVNHLSARYNGPECSSELLFTTEDDTALYYLRREPSGKSWVENRITRKGKKSIQFDAFVTTIVLTDGKGKPVPLGYPIDITSEPLHFVANEKSYASGRQKTTLTTDGNGSVLIAIPSNGKLACPSLDVTVGSFNFKIDPSKRVDRLFGKLNTENAFTEAKGSNGKLLFGGCPSETLSGASSVLGKYGEIKASVQTSSENTGTKNIDLSLGQSQSLGASAAWFDSAVSPVESFLGDCIDAIKTVVKSVVKVALKIVGPVVKLIFKIGKAIFSFVLKGLNTVLTAIGNFLENAFGLDFLNKLLNYLKAAFDPNTVKKTQDVLNVAFTGGMKVTERFLTTQRHSITDMFDDIEDIALEYIDDPREPPRGGSEEILASFSWIVNNPVVRLISKINPMAWIMEALTEEFPDVTAPSIKPLMSGIVKVLGNSGLDQLDLLVQLWDTFVREISTVLADPEQLLSAIVRAAKSVAWHLFDSLKGAVLAMYDLIVVFVTEMGHILTGTWKLGGLTDMWEELTGSEFSIMSFLTYPVAVMMNLGSLAATGKLPFEGQREAFVDFDFDSIEIKPIYTAQRRNKLGKESITKMRSADIETPPLKHDMAESHTQSLAASAPFPLMQANTVSFSTMGNQTTRGQVQTTPPMSVRETFRQMCIVLENVSRYGVSANLIMQAQYEYASAQFDKGFRTPEGGGQRMMEDAVQALEKWDAVAQSAAAKLRLGTYFVHGGAIVAGAFLKEKPMNGVDIANIGFGITEIMLCGALFVGVSEQAVNEVGGLLVEGQTILRSCSELPIGAAEGLYIASSVSALVAYGCNKGGQPEIAAGFIAVDVTANMVGICLTLANIATS